MKPRFRTYQDALSQINEVWEKMDYRDPKDPAVFAKKLAEVRELSALEPESDEPAEDEAEYQLAPKTVKAMKAMKSDKEIEFLRKQNKIPRRNTQAGDPDELLFPDGMKKEDESVGESMAMPKHGTRAHYNHIMGRSSKPKIGLMVLRFKEAVRKGLHEDAAETARALRNYHQECLITRNTDKSTSYHEKRVDQWDYAADQLYRLFMEGQRGQDVGSPLTEEAHALPPDPVMSQALRGFRKMAGLDGGTGLPPVSAIGSTRPGSYYRRVIELNESDEDDSGENE